VLLAAEMWFRMTLTESFVLFVVFIQPLIIALLGLWMLQSRGGNYAIFVIIGSGMSGLWSNLVFVSGQNISNERWNDTLETLIGIPTPLQVILLGKNLASVALSVSSMVLGYVVASILLNYPLNIAQPVGFFISLVLALISFVSFGLLIAPLYLVSPAVESWRNAIEYPVYILAGFLFPIALLPIWSNPISYLLAPYWAARALHGTSSGGATSEEILLSWGMMILFSAIYVFLAMRLFRVMLRKARIDGTLTVD
jgi:ABC-2 type transport system permease protein